MKHVIQRSGARVACAALCVIGFALTGASRAAVIQAPATSASGSFSVSWPSGYELWHDDVSWPVTGDSPTSASFSQLPAGRYRFVLAACAWTYAWELGYLYSCERAPGSEKSVLVTGPDAPVVDQWAEGAGTTGYSSGVSERGGAEIAVPLRAPQGLGGVALDLALAYDSVRGGDRSRHVVDDLVGYGWHLRGLSAIHRCRVGQGGSHYPGGLPQLTYDDGLCLDGEPLVLVSGSHWGAGAEYRVGADPDRRVALRSAPGHGLWFEVGYPDGSVGRFGDTSGSRVRASGRGDFAGRITPNEPFVWGLRRLTGAAGGELEVSYQRYDGYGVLQPATVAFGGAEVRFSYGAREDLAPVALDWATRVRRLSVLNRVEVRMNGKPVREYRLASKPDAAGRVVLERIQECGFDLDGGAAQCLPPLEIQWATIAGDAVSYPVVVAELRDGLGARTGFDYARIGPTVNPLGYTEAPFGALLDIPETTPGDVLAVAEYRLSDGRSPDGLRRWRYAYKGAPRQSSSSRGYLGFAEVRATDVQTGVVSYSQMRLDWPFVGAVSQIRSFDARFGSHTREVAREEHAYAQKVHANGVRHAYPARSTRWLLEKGVTVGATIEQRSFCYRIPNGDQCPGSGTERDPASQYRVVTTSGTGLTNPAFAPAFWGDVPQRAVAEQHVRRTVTELATLVGSSTPWIRNAVVRRTVTHAVPGAAARTVAETFSHLAGTRIVERAMRFPGVTGLERTTTRSFDPASIGMLKEETVQGANMVPRTWRFATPYQDGRYVSEVTNPLGQTVGRTVDPRFGEPLEIVDADGRATAIEYDPFGRIVRETRADGTEVATRYERCDQADCGSVQDADPALRVTVSTRSAGLQTAPTRVTYLDVLGREVLRELEGLDPAQGWRSQRIGYDGSNRMRYFTRPVVGAAAPVCTAPGSDCTWLTWDTNDRVVREDRPDGGVTTTTFGAASGKVTVTRTETVKTPGASNSTRTTRATFDVLGQLTETVEAVGSSAGTTTAYTYDAHGNLATVTVAGVRVATLEHDLAGNRTKLTEASSGVTGFAYNALGELVSSTDARGQTTSFEYDLLGRLLRRVDAGGTAHAWTWDPVDATGRLASRTRPGFAETYRYDATNGRLLRIDTQVNVSGVWTGTASREFGYDAAGRLTSQRYPNGQVVGYDYSQTGYLNRVTGGGIVLHEVRATDGFGMASDERFHGAALRSQKSFSSANGLVTRIRTGTATAAAAIQDLETTWRSDRALYRRADRRGTSTSGDDYVDTFAYDAVGRLTRQTTTGAAARTLQFGHAANGNLVDMSSNIVGDSRAHGFVFGTTDPYRLTSVTLDGVPTALAYDANGNVQRYTPTVGSPTWLRYDARNNVTRITVGPDESTVEARDEFWYDPDGQRFLSRETWRDGAGLASRSILALGADYEETRSPVGATHDVIQRIQVTPIARLVRRRDAQTGAWSTVSEYLHRDHLGSVEVITDGTGAILARQSFDPFGARRALNRSGSLPPTELEALLALQDVVGARGYTGHEHRNRTGFIHMNGRVYDPRVGRFVSPDPMVQAPWSGQGQNRYAYAMGSPLSHVDPTGRCSSEVRAPMPQCRDFEEHIVVVGTGGSGSRDFFHSLDRAGVSRLVRGSMGAGGRGAGAPWLDRDALRENLQGARDEPLSDVDPAGEVIEEVVVVAAPLPGQTPIPSTYGWIARGLTNLHRVGVGSLFGSGCIGAVLGGCGALAVQTGDGSVYGMLMFGVIPGAGVSIGTEGAMFSSEFQGSWGYGTALFVSGGVSGIGGSIGMAQGTNGFNITGAAGYGFGFGGGVGFYVSGPLGARGE